MVDDEVDAYWAAANRISDRIVDMINAERRKPGFTPTQMMAGQMLALLALMRTSPEHVRPRTFQEALFGIEACLAEVLEASKREP